MRLFITIAGVSSLATVPLLATPARAAGPVPGSIPENEHGLKVVGDGRIYLRTVAEKAEKRLVDLEEVPGVRLDVRYATPNNLMGRPLYPAAKAYLRAPAAEALMHAQQELEARGLGGLKVYDAYRPYSVTKEIWEPYKNPRFVADPAEGSRHNRGCAVDLTLVDARGEELLMPTDFDDFTEKAAHGYEDLPEEAIHNRNLLREVMEGHGFVALPTEWWHYDFKGWERFEILDLPLDGVPAA